MSCWMLLWISASEEIAFGHTSGYIAFCSISLGLACLISLKDSSIAPRHSCKPSGHIQTSTEEMRWIRERFCVNSNKDTVTASVSERACCVAGVLCDLQKRGGYFHHATTSPHWPCNGAMQSLDWLPRLKTPLSCCCRVWKSSLAQHASVHGRVCLHTYHCH